MANRPTSPAVPRIKGQGRDVLALAIAIETLRGERGDGLDRAVTYRDLIKTGAFVLSGERTRTLAPAGTDTGKVFAPTQPQGVTATGGFAFIMIEWDAPTFGGFSMAQVWRAQSNDYGVATLIATTTAAMYADTQVQIGAGYYYWVRFVNRNGVVGPLHDTSGVFARTAEDIEGLIMTLEGQLSESQFSETLNSRIALIDAPDNVEGSVSGRIAHARSELIEQINDLGEATASSLTMLYTATSGNSAAIESESIARASADSSMASQINTLQSTVGSQSALISSVSTVQAGISAQQFIKLDVNGYVTGYGAYNNGPGASGFVVHADLFAVGKPGMTSGYPFMIGTVDGATKIVLNGASFLSDSTITTAKIASAAITEAKIANASISTAKIADASIASAKIADLAVTNVKIGNASISTAKIEDLAVSSGKINDLAVSTLKIQDNAVTVPQYASSYGGSISTSWEVAVSITVNWGSNIPGGIMLIGSMNCLAGGSGNETLAIRFRQGSTGSTDGDVGVSAASGFSVGLTGTAGFMPVSSVETYYLEVKKSFGASYTQGAKNLLLLGIKK